MLALMARARGLEKKQVLLRFELPIHAQLSAKADRRGKSLPEYLQDLAIGHAVSASKNAPSGTRGLNRADVTPKFKAGNKSTSPVPKPRPALGSDPGKLSS